MTTHNVNIPGSKSIAARALVCRLLGGHDTMLTNLPDCGDTRGMLRLTEAVRQALATGNPVKVDIGEGGTTLRFGMAACASIPGLDITLTGSPRLMERPHATLVDALRDMGADITAIPEENAIHIKGKLLSGGILELDGSVSSQYLSALMLAAPTWQADTRFILKGQVVSRPYIEMTAGVMRAFGADVNIKSEESRVKGQGSDSNFQFSIFNSQFEVCVRATGYAQCARYDIEGDWSGASYFFELRLIAEELGLELPEFSMPALKSPAESLQGDSRVAAIFAEASRKLAHGRSVATGMDASNVQHQTYNLSDAPDLVPAVAVGLCVAGIPFRIEGVGHLRHKESDRMAAIATELRRIGYVIATGDDTMTWDGSRCEPEAEPLIRTYKDHRMAMAFAPAKLAFPALRIEDPGVVEKSFPDYWLEISKLWKGGFPTPPQAASPLSENL
ncbi:MAG: 3-phosphoshikimate 1-carboxyvinyltransferase [Muribaculaceae bacterium]|nr:3-phosphoshikimate 1-carboxyvinyltransferase [Muribaculaceae bacterium]